MGAQEERNIIGTRAWHEAEAETDRIAYEEDGEPDGCYWCGSQQHKTSDCHTQQTSDVAYQAGYAYASGYHD